MYILCQRESTYNEEPYISVIIYGIIISILPTANHHTRTKSSIVITR